MRTKEIVTVLLAGGSLFVRRGTVGSSTPSSVMLRTSQYATLYDRYGHEAANSVRMTQVKSMFDRRILDRPGDWWDWEGFASPAYERTFTADDLICADKSRRKK